MQESQFDVLRGAARLSLNAAAQQRLHEACTGVSDWSGFTALAETHGLAPLLYEHARQHELPIPTPVRRELQGLVLRHEHANRVRLGVLREILQTLASREIPAIVLKGGALAYVLYPRPGLRPMRDLDILIGHDRARESQQVLSELGFSVPTQAPSPFLERHHHLPNAGLQRDGLFVSVELHVDALSYDVPARLPIDRLSAAPQPFSVDGLPARTLGHIDMLHHLWRHNFEPAATTRMISITDLVEYALKFHAAIDWRLLGRRCPGAINALALVHYLTPLPPGLDRLRPPANTPPPDGIGRGLRPISHIFKRHRPVFEILRELLRPPPWWLHAHYGIPPERSLRWCRRVTHPLRVASWLRRRLTALLAARLKRR